MNLSSWQFPLLLRLDWALQPRADALQPTAVIVVIALHLQQIVHALQCPVVVLGLLEVVLQILLFSWTEIRCVCCEQLDLAQLMSHEDEVVGL